VIEQAFGEENMSSTQKIQTTDTEEGETGELRSQENAHHFSLTPREFSQRVRPGEPNSQFCILLLRFTATVCKCAMTSP
jgi:hypothetical protein